jgi:hypothetical protein
MATLNYLTNKKLYEVVYLPKKKLYFWLQTYPAWWRRTLAQRFCSSRRTDTHPIWRWTHTMCMTILFAKCTECLKKYSYMYTVQYWYTIQHCIWLSTLMYLRCIIKREMELTGTGIRGKIYYEHLTIKMGQSHEIFDPRFFHQSILLQSLINGLNHSCIWLRICREIRKYKWLRDMQHSVESTLRYAA